MDNLFDPSVQSISTPAIPCVDDALMPQPVARALPGSLTGLHRHIDVFCYTYGPRLLRISIGVVFLWFGVLKFFPTVSPAEEIAVQTLRALTFDMIPARTLLFGLAAFETVVGACFVLGVFGSLALPLLFAHMLGTATPFLMFPRDMFAQPFVPTFLGQYIVKNIIIVSAAIVLRRGFR